jgi:hypothetical protein
MEYSLVVKAGELHLQKDDGTEKEYTIEMMIKVSIGWLTTL